ncbi:MAG: 16S rRNA (guanine(527)-N(7))-methyltransferase RsmG [Chloroflexi bacterium]|nr:16S rRNA (guanine(527)-N(7))-methyltransferase RsmG [Chloroflexota bacterium]
MDRLLRGAAALGVVLTPAQIEHLERYAQLLAEWNQRFNLTSARALERAEVVHFLDSLSVAAALPAGVTAGGCLADIGSGAGFPGLPLKLAFPACAVTLVESVGKKARFLCHVVESLGLQSVQVVAGRAEEAARRPDLRERFDAVLARALGKLPVALELTLPFAKVGGLVVLPKQGDFQAELEGAQKALDLLGGALLRVQAVTVPGLEGPRALVVVQKIAPTPEQYPRRPGIPAKRPLR